MRTFTEAEYLGNPGLVFEAAKEGMVQIVGPDGRPCLTIGSTAPDTREDWEHALEELRYNYDEPQIIEIVHKLNGYFASQLAPEETDRGQEDGS